MNDQVSAVQVVNAAVDTGRVAPVTSTTSTVKNEPSMAEYAELRTEADKSGKSIESIIKDKADVITEAEAAAAAKAAATDKANADDKKTTEPATEIDPVTQIEDNHVAKKGVEKRFGELTAQREAAKAEAATAKAQLELLKAEAEAAKKAAEAIIIPVVPKAEDDPVPNRELFDDPDQYSAAIAGHAAREAIRQGNKAAEAAQAERVENARKAQEAAQQAHAQAQINDLHKSFNEKVTKAATEYPDFAEKVTNNDKLSLRNDVFFAVEKAELAPHILYHLASNPEEAAKINAMQPYDAAIRIGELQAEIRISRKPQVTKAAEPIKPIANRTSPEVKSLDEMSMDEYAAHRAAEDKAKWEKEYGKRRK
jgi:hypothetical protein